MALNERYLFFDSVGDDNRDYTSEDFAWHIRQMYTTGLLRAANPLAVSADGVSMNLGITAGGALIRGRFYELVEDGNISVPISPQDARYYVVLRLNLTTEARSITLYLKPGTASALPELQRDGSIWELALASVFATASRAYIAPGDVADLRTDRELCGYSQRLGDPAYYPTPDLPQLLWMYAFFPNTLTEGQKEEVRNNPSLIEIFENSRALPLDWRLLTSYKTAGTYTWTAPDIYGDGEPFEIGAFIIGGGGAGGLGFYGGGGASAKAAGGASGYTKAMTLFVTPGSLYNLVVGKGGTIEAVAAAANVYPSLANANGGSSSFGGNTVFGGDGGYGSGSYEAAGVLNGARGGQGSDIVYPSGSFEDGSSSGNRFAQAPAMGRIPADNISNIAAYTAYGGGVTPTMCYNPFDRKKYLGAGGGAIASLSQLYTQDVPILDDGLRAGKGTAANARADFTGEAATSPGSGGGGVAIATASASGTITVKTGAGADGAVFIYARRPVR